MSTYDERKLENPSEHDYPEDIEELEAAAEVYDKAAQDEEAFGYFRGDDQTITPRKEKECFAGMTDRELHAYKRILGDFNKNTIFVGPAGRLDRHRKMVAKEIAKRTRRNKKRRQDVFDRYRATAEVEAVEVTNREQKY